MERGGATVPVLASEGAKASLIEPTSLNRGEGLIAELTGEAGGVEGEGEGEVVVERWWWRNERTNEINHDVVDGCFKLRSPP